MVLYLQVLLWRQLRAVELVGSGGVLVVNKSKVRSTCAFAYRKFGSPELYECSYWTTYVYRRGSSD